MLKLNVSHYQDFTHLDQWLYYIENLHSTEIDMGLVRIQQVAERLAIDLAFATVITVAGTNGKGTTCAFLENALLDPALNLLINKEKGPSSVAVYASPHIEKFNERLRIDKRDVSDAALITAFNKIEQARRDISLSYYEYTTLAALLVLMDIKPSFIILEVGLGGRLDATNIIDADIAVITTIDLDHQAFLGNDRESIGFEKAGIMRANQIIVIGDTNAPQSVLNYAFKMSGGNDSHLHIRDQHFTILENEHKEGNNEWLWQSTQDHRQSLNQLINPYIPRDNIATALMVLTALSEPLNLTLDSDFVNRIIKQTKVAGRTELFKQSTSCDVILDVGHNPQASRYLSAYLQQLKRRGKYHKVHAVVAMLGDKDIANSLSALVGDVEHWYVGQLNLPRAATAEVMAQHLKSQSSSESNIINCFDNVSDAFKIANKHAKLNDLILVFGSFYTVAEIRQLLLRKADS